MPRQVSHFLLRGGLDLVSSPLTVRAGRLWTGLNYEPADAGYRRIRGFERVDGRPAPSEALYWLLGREGADAAAVGQTITGQTSNATGVVLAIGDGAYVLGEVNGAFEIGEALAAAGQPAGEALGVSTETSAPTIDLDLDYRRLAAEHRRSAIQAVPGSGPVRGVWVFDNTLYAMRDNTGGSAGVMHRATPTGWQAVELGAVIRFRDGSVEPSPGDRISEQGGASATLSAVVVIAGSWTGNDAAGRLYLRMDSGAFQSGQTLRRGLVGGEAAFAVAGGAPAALALPAGGRYEFVNHNFRGQRESRQMLGVNGVGNAFIWDGRALTSIFTGHADDRPTHLDVHRNHLLLGYRGGSLIVSATGDPLSFDATRGAAEIACGQTILALEEGVGDGNTLIVGEDRIQVLYGNDSSDFQLADQSNAETGGVEWTIQNIGAPIYLDNRGIRSVETTDRYGNFLIGTMTTMIQPWLDRQRDARNKPTASMRVRSSDQYRLFLESGIGIIIFLGRGEPEISFLNYGVAVRCATSIEDEDRIERIYFGSDDGWVFEAERGRSFDGREIAAYARLPLNHVGAPTVQKRFFTADIHLDLQNTTQLAMSGLFNDGGNPDQLFSDESLFGGGVLWGEGAWDEGYWDAPLNGYGSFDMAGIGRNVSLLFRSVTDREASHTLNGVSLHWAPRRAER